MEVAWLSQGHIHVQPNWILILISDYKSTEFHGTCHHTSPLFKCVSNTM